MLIRPPNTSLKDRNGGSTKGARGGWWERFVEDWQPIWAAIEEAVEGLMGLLEQGGRLILQFAELAQGLHGFVRDHGGRWVVLAAALGISSPMTGGWGSSRLADLPLGIWAPAVALPLAAILLRSTLGAVAGESKRRAKRQERERRDSTIERELTIHNERRQIANERLTARGGDGVLDGQEFVHDTVAATYLRAAGSHTDDLILLLLGLEGGRFELVASRNLSDDALAAAVRLPWGKLIASDNAFEGALAPLQYRSAPVAFAASQRHYVLLGLSGATISEETTLEISKGATELMSLLAYGKEAPRWMAEEI